MQASDADEVAEEIEYVEEDDESDDSEGFISQNINDVDNKDDEIVLNRYLVFYRQIRIEENIVLY